MNLYVAFWWHTFGDVHGVAGIFSTESGAYEALNRLAPRSDHEVVGMILDEGAEGE